jgi:alkylation response protein AidB-like acyl-CoA dehydrogenase
MTLTQTGRDLLDDELLADFDQRAPVYDRHITFCNEDFEELRRRGYVLASVPEAFGAAGLNLAEINQLRGRAC